MQELTYAEDKCLETIKEYMVKNGYCPTVKELMKELHYSSLAFVSELLLRLEDKHYIERCGNRAMKVKGVHYVREE